MARLILDTGVVIAAVRGRIELSVLADTDDLALPAVVVAECLAGTMQDADTERAAARRSFLDDVLQVVPVHAYDVSVAEHHAVLTTDRHARLDELPDVAARVVPR